VPIISHACPCMAFQLWFVASGSPSAQESKRQTTAKQQMLYDPLTGGLWSTAELRAPHVALTVWDGPSLLVAECCTAGLDSVKGLYAITIVAATASNSTSHPAPPMQYRIDAQSFVLGTMWFAHNGKKLYALSVDRQRLMTIDLDTGNRTLSQFDPNPAKRSVTSPQQGKSQTKNQKKKALKKLQRQERKQQEVQVQSGHHDEAEKKTGKMIPYRVEFAEPRASELECHGVGHGWLGGEHYTNNCELLPCGHRTRECLN